MYSLNPDLKNDSFLSGTFTVFDLLNHDEIEVIKKNAGMRLLKGELEKEKQTPSIMSYEDKPLYRNSRIKFIENNSDDPELSMVYKKIAKKLIDVNHDVFKFNLTDLEPFQFTSYEKDEYYHRHLDFHTDLYPGTLMRKLSASIQLSDPTEYEGGDLCVYVCEKPMVANKKKGSMTFFPSFTLHEVTPVTYGHRLSLVVWAWGPRFI